EFPSFGTKSRVDALNVRGFLGNGKFAKGSGFQSWKRGVKWNKGNRVRDRYSVEDGFFDFRVGYCEPTGVVKELLPLFLIQRIFPLNSHRRSNLNQHTISRDRSR